MQRIVIASLLACTAFTQETPIVWGGDHVRMQVSAKSATLDFDCAHGTVDGALTPDSKGRFEVKGTFTPEHAGPVREDISLTRPATFSGTINGDAMTLRITFGGEDPPPPAVFELTRGREGRVHKCR